MSIELGKDERRAIARKARVAVLDAVRALGGEGLRRDILDRARRAGGFSAAELAAPAPERAGGNQLSYVEYRLSWELSNLKRDGLLDNPHRGVWRLTDAAKRKPEPLIRVRVSLDRLAELRAMSLRDYLDSPEWQRTRVAALERAEHRCSRDRRHKDQLEVHHDVRVRIGAELPSDLVVLCRSCYEQHHKITSEPAAVTDASEFVEAASIAPPTADAQASAAQASDELDSGSLFRRIFSRA
jgi:Mrr restriction endonuclease-like protein